MAKVGTAYVTIKPDLSKFSEELKAGLAKLNPELNVRLVPQLRGFRRELNAKLAEVTPRPVRVDVRPDLSEFNALLRAKLAAMNLPYAKVNVRPDLTGFTRLLRIRLAALNMPTASVKVTPDVDGFGAALAAGAVRSINRDTGDQIRQTIRRTVTPRIEQSGTDTGRSWARRFFGGIRTEFREAGQILGRISDGVTSVFSNWILGIAVATAITFALGFIGALVPALLGISFVGLGAFLLKDEKKIVDRFTALGKKIQKALLWSAEPLIKPLLEVAKIFDQAVTPISQSLREIFQIIGPHIPTLAKGISGFLTEIFKAFKDPKTMAMVVSTMDVVAEHLPNVGKAIGQFFKDVGGSDPKQTADVLREFFLGLEGTIVIVGKIIGFFVDLTGWFKDTGGAIQTWVAGTSKSVQEHTESSRAAISSYIPIIKGNLTTAYQGVMTAVQSVAVSLTVTFVGALLKTQPYVKTFVTGMLELDAAILRIAMSVWEHLQPALKILQAPIMLPAKGFEQWFIVQMFNIEERLKPFVGLNKIALERAASYYKLFILNAVAALIKGTPFVIAAAKAIGRAFAKQLAAEFKIVIRFVAELPHNIANVLNTLPMTFREMGRQIIRSLVQGMLAMIPSVLDAVRSIASLIPDTVKKVLKFGSPSKILVALGEGASESLAIGIEKALAPVSAAATAMGLAAIPTLAMPGVPSFAANPFGPDRFDVRVFIGERELTDIVRTEVDGVNEDTARAMLGGRRV